jgi:hypothetical protein
MGERPGLSAGAKPRAADPIREVMRITSDGYNWETAKGGAISRLELVIKRLMIGFPRMGMVTRAATP